MKTRYLYLLFVMSATLIFNSCSDSENITFDSQNGQTLLAFASTSVDLQIEIGATGQVTVPVNSTTSSSSERTYNVKVVEEGTTAFSSSYNVGTVVIPANEFVGSLTITGNDDGNITTTPRPLILAIESTDGAVTADNLTVNILQICPINDTFFLGQYRVTTISPGVFGASTYGGDGNIVTLEVGENSLSRIFTANYFGDSRFPREFQFSLVCNEVIVPYQDQRVGCGGNDVNLSTGPSTTGNGTYNATDDSSFTVKLTDNVDSDCGGTPVQAEYLFTKIE